LGFGLLQVRGTDRLRRAQRPRTGASNRSTGLLDFAAPAQRRAQVEPEAGVRDVLAGGPEAHGGEELGRQQAVGRPRPDP
jgi:hypothetical protein